MPEDARSDPRPAKRMLVAIARFAGPHRDDAMPVAMEEVTQEGFDRLLRLVPDLPRLGYPFRNAAHGLLLVLLEPGRAYERPMPAIFAGDPLLRQPHAIVFFRRQGEGLFQPEWYARATLEAEGVRCHPGEPVAAAAS